MAEAPQLGGMFDISDILQSLGNKGWTGTVEIIAGDQQKIVFVFFRDGVIQHAKPAEARAALGLMLYKLRKIDLADLNFVLTAQEQTNQNFGQTCLQFGLVTEGDIREALLFRGREEILGLFLESGRTDARFYPEETPKEDAFTTEDCEINLNLNPMGLLMEAARREDEWKLIQEDLDSLEEVFVRVQDDSKKVPVQLRSILLLCDGFRTVEEIARYSPWPVFESYGIIRDLFKDGFLQTVGPMELARAAVAAEAENDAEKALRLFELAEARGLNRVEISKRIALAHQHLGHKVKAFQRWIVFANKCLENNDVASAIEGFLSAIEVDPAQVEAYYRLADIYEQHNQGSLGADLLRKLIDHLKEQEDQVQLVAAYQRYVSFVPGDLEMLKNLAELHVELEEATNAIERFDQLAQLHKDGGKPESAVEVYRRMLEVDEECLTGRLALAETLAEMGEAKDSVSEYQALAAILERSGLKGDNVNWSFLIKVYESIIELDASLDDAWAFLAKTYAREQKFDLAVSRYMGLVQALAKQSNRQREMIEPLEKVIDLAPERIDVRQQLGRLFVNLNERGRALKTYFEMANYAIAHQNKNLARDAYRLILELEPMNLEARAGQARIDESNGKYEVAARRWRIVGSMAVRAGLFEKAEQALRRALNIDNEHMETLKDLADAKEGLMHHDEAANILVRYANIMIREKNFGMARQAIEKIRVLTPDRPELANLAKALEPHF